MNSSQIKEIIKLNNNFYEKNALEFSSSRLYPWKGWFKLPSILNSLSETSVSFLDLGCGNGRFLEFLYKYIQKEHITYLGIDSNKILLNFANEKFKIKNSKIKFQCGNIFNLKDLPKTKFDTVVAFGVTHHIPGSDFRKKWFIGISKLVNKGGYLVLSFWNPNSSKLLKETLTGFETGDYLMSWDTNDTRRYVHIYSKSEIESIEKNVFDLLFELELQYKNDIKKESYNEYFVFKKIR